ncbi:MAG: thioesterase [Planctomycetaceae bacterium]|nr:thioesterase [Planctomycetaceae bacterium]
MNQQTIEVRVRYAECDPMGFAHHSAYAAWFEMARTELLRQHGRAYAELEREGVYIVVVRLNVHYQRPARYDDALRVTAVLRRSGGAKIEHEYEVRRGEEVLSKGSTVLACIDREGRVRAVPDFLRTSA